MGGWDPTKTHANITLSGTGNVTATANAAGTYQSAIGVDDLAGKKYWEIYLDNRTSAATGGFGICGPNTDEDDAAGHTADAWSWNHNNYRFHDSVQGAYVYGVAASVVYMFALDKTAGKLFFGRGGAWRNGANPATGDYPHFEDAGISGASALYPHYSNTIVSNSATIRTALADFSYTPPSGYDAPDVAIYTALEDQRLSLRAAGFDISDLPASLAAILLALVDARPWLMAAATGGGLAADSLPAPMHATALVQADIRARLGAYARALENLAIPLQALYDQRQDIAMLLEAVSPEVLRSLGLDLRATDGTSLDSLAIVMWAVKKAPSYQAVIAQRLRSVTREET